MKQNVNFLKMIIFLSPSDHFNLFVWLCLHSSVILYIIPCPPDPTTITYHNPVLRISGSVPCNLLFPISC